MSGDEAGGTARAAEARWAQERADLLAQLAVESARSVELTRRLLEQQQAVRPGPALVRDTGARLLALEAERHAAEVARLRGSERAAVERAGELARQLRALRAELRALEAEHAAQRMHAELELSRAQAEVSALQAAARRREAAARPDRAAATVPGALPPVQPSPDGPPRRDEAVVVAPERVSPPQPAPVPGAPHPPRTPRRTGSWRR